MPGALPRARGSPLWRGRQHLPCRLVRRFTVAAIATPARARIRAPVSDLALDPVTGDLLVTVIDGIKTLTKVTGIGATAQRLAIRMRLFLGDWYLNLLQGIPYHQTVLRKGCSPALRREVFRRPMATLPGVAEVTSLSVELDGATRRLDVRAQLRLTTGEVLVVQDSPPLFDFGVIPDEGI